MILEDLNKSFADKQVLKNVEFAIARNEKVGIVGENGIGKSTLLKIISHQLEADSGKIEWGHEAQIAYCAQDTREFFTENLTVQEWLMEHTKISVEATIRGALGRVLFSGETAKKRVANLSGGERSRLVFAKMMIEMPNVLLLDEPTNHLDLESSDSLAASLKKYPGTLMVVSHDRHFLNQVCTRIIALTHKGISDYQGNYSQYVAVHGEDFLSRVVSSSKQKTKAAPSNTKVSFEDRKALQKQIAQKEKRVAQLQATMDGIESKIKVVDAKFAKPDFFDNASTQEIAELTAQKKDYEKEVKTAWQEWEVLEHEVKELKKGL